jgi:hypothetical protein
MKVERDWVAKATVSALLVWQSPAAKVFLGILLVVGLFFFAFLSGYVPGLVDHGGLGPNWECHNTPSDKICFRDEKVRQKTTPPR